MSEKRIIKFRALKDDLPCHFVYGHLIRNAEGAPRIQEDSAKLLFTTCLPGTEGQYTGLLDKNGKEIYEGDVVRYQHDMGGWKYDETHEVKWNFGKFEFGPFHFGNMPGVFSVRDNQIKLEVIGNIHENPELIDP